MFIGIFDRTSTELIRVESWGWTAALSISEVCTGAFTMLRVLLVALHGWSGLSLRLNRFFGGEWDVVR